MTEPVELGSSSDGAWLWANEPCRAACPVHTDAGAYVTAIAEGRDRDAYRIARASNPFVSICGRVCAAPCETACRRGTVDAPIAIRSLKRFVTEQFGVESFEAAAEWHAAHGDLPPVDRGSVAIVGGGPAGLAAAHDLRANGFAVTLYEAADRLGGLMVLGIPEYRLERALIERECQAIIDMGVEAHLGTGVGDDVSFEDLVADHDAVLLAAGCMLGRSLPLEGADLDGHTTAMEFLLNVNQGFHVDLGGRVVVVGGGNVAFDAARTATRTLLDVARTARREGAPDVTVIALESPEEMPADAIEIQEATEEGITILYRRGPVRFVGDGSVVTGLETIEVASVFDPDGRFSPTFVDGTESVLPADTIILAVGQAPDLGWLGTVELERSPRGGLEVDTTTLRTSHPKVWAGGDIARGPRNLIDAVADGRPAARRSPPSWRVTAPRPRPCRSP